jgi:hypothetical protein
MTSKNPPKAYDETMLDALEKALKDVLEVLAAHYPEREWDDTDLKTALAGKLMAFADSGVREPHELRNRILQSLPLGYTH